MIILLIVLIFLFSCFATVPNINCYAASPSPQYYARVMSDNVYLYKTPYNLDDVSNLYFCLPKTYFVNLVAADGEFYKVNYLDFSGYVKKEEVQPIVGTPATPYLENINFRIFADLSRDLRTEPNTFSGTSSQVVYLPLYSRNLTYFGTIEGEQLIPDRTNVWLYCKYSADKDYFGYVYSDFCDKITPIIENSEEVSYTTEPDFLVNTTPPTTALKPNSKATAIIIIALSVPSLAFVLLILKNSKLIKADKAKKGEVIDY